MDDPIHIDLRGFRTTDSLEHTLVASVVVTDNRGIYFCSCGFSGSATAFAAESLWLRLAANHADHKGARISWAKRQEKK